MFDPDLMPVHTALPRSELFSRHSDFCPITLDVVSQNKTLTQESSCTSTFTCVPLGKWWISYLQVTNAFDPTKPKALEKQRILSLLCNHQGYQQGFQDKRCSTALTTCSTWMDFSGSFWEKIGRVEYPRARGLFYLRRSQGRAGEGTEQC